jgi:hypothetical protein
MHQIKLCENVNCFTVAGNRVQWWVHVSTKSILCFHNRRDISLLATRRVLLDVVDSSTCASASYRFCMVGWFSVVGSIHESEVLHVLPRWLRWKSSVTIACSNLCRQSSVAAIIRDLEVCSILDLWFE